MQSEPSDSTVHRANVTLASVPAPQEPPAAVSLAAEALHIHSLSTSDRDVVSAAAGRRSEDLVHFARAALETGAKVITVGATSLGIDNLASQLDAVHARTEAATAESARRITAAVAAATDPATGAVAVTLQKTLAAFGREVETLVAGENAPVRQALTGAIDRLSQESSRQVREAIAAQSAAVSAAISPDDPQSAFGVLRSEVRGSSDSLRDSVSAALGEMRGLAEAAKVREAARKKSPLGGLDFEYETGIALTASAAALAQGDTLQRVGTTPTPGGTGKKGDLIIHLRHEGAPRTRIAVEVKSVTKPLSSYQWGELLELACTQRGATAALGVFEASPEDMPAGESFMVLAPGRLVVAWRPGESTARLHAAYVIARTHALERALADAGFSIDVVAVRAALTELTSALHQFDGVQRSCRLTARHANLAIAAVDALREDLAAKVARSVRLVSATTSGRPSVVA